MADLNNFDPDIHFLNHMYNDINTNTTSIYIDATNFKALRENNKTAFLSMNFNIRSFNKNNETFSALLESLKIEPDVICLTETWLHNDNKHLAILEGYDSHHTVRTNGHGGGTSIFYKQNYNGILLDELSLCNNHIESCCIELRHNTNEKIILISIYRPPNGPIEQFNNELLNMLNNEYLNNKKILITGDLNINLLDQNNIATSTLMNNMHSLHFMPTITKPTRFPPNNIVSPSLLDHTWVNSYNHIQSAIYKIDITDHCPTFSFLKLNTNISNEKTKISFRLYNEINYNKFYETLSNFRWDFNNHNDINDKFQYFYNTLNKIYTKNFPLKTKQISKNRASKPWLTQAILDSIKTKARNFKLLKLGLISHEKNNRYKNILNSVIKNAKKQYYKRAFINNKQNLKKTWTMLKNLMGKKRHKTVKSIIMNNTPLTSDLDIANS